MVIMADIMFRFVVCLLYDLLNLASAGGKGGAMLLPRLLGVESYSQSRTSSNSMCMRALRFPFFRTLTLRHNLTQLSVTEFQN